MSFHDVGIRAISQTEGLTQEFKGLNLNTEIPATGATISPPVAAPLYAVPETGDIVTKPPVVDYSLVHVMGAYVPETGVVAKKKTCKYCGKNVSQKC